MDNSTAIRIAMDLWTSTFILYWTVLTTLFENALSQCSGSPLTITATETPTKLTTAGYPTAYSNDLYCEWLVDSGVAGQRLLLYSDDVDVNCPGDSFTIYNGNSTTDAILEGPTCGNSATTNVFWTSGRYALLTFTTDASTVQRGLQMTYVTAADTSGSACTAEYTLTASSTPQYLTSEGFPGKYASNSNCRWHIKASTTLSTVFLEVVFSDIENDDSCRYDKMVIYDGSYVCENQLIHTECPERTSADSTPSSNLTSSGDSFTIILSSDTSFERHGFIIKYYEHFVNYTTTTFSTTSLTSSVAMTTKGNTALLSEQQTTTSQNLQISIPIMVSCAIAGAATVLGVIALCWMVKHIKAKKRAKKGLITVRAIAPLPPRRTTALHQRPSSSVLAFV
ncbi:deleted in malignant brain tumors 1 protein-like isoform X2 [Mya arenaria]|uniref:deleted in malignant brain tumors 1 protein-like isoform X2 n=1 Tax=Mya arenaria TaxID=6604 RepID=UPI0022E1A012|nr:deleted in malignant brain tumors 1 protein-like isoform X2 [Mya arenaria]